MSRPRSGVVEVFAGTTGLTDIEQGSGVLVAPDEVLTAAHVVDGAGGICREPSRPVDGPP